MAFLIEYNQGFPITIPDMAKAFFVKDPKDSNSGNDKIATIDCNFKLPFYPHQEDYTKCSDPDFLIAR